MIRRRRRDEAGAFVIIWMVALAALVGTAALAIDLGKARGGVAFSQSIADFAALAAGPSMSTNPPDYLSACENAISYLATNADAPPIGAIDPAAFCTAAGNDVTQTVCSGGGLAEAQPTLHQGPYTVSIHFPVPASEIANSGYGTGLDDGTPCQRLRVLVSVSQPSFFGGVAGYGGEAVTRSATLRAAPGGDRAIPALWLLEPFGCTPLSVSGGSVVDVGTSTQAGYVSIDSDGTTCSSNQDTVSVSGTGSTLAALPSNEGPGAISLVALPAGSTTCVDPACSSADVAAGRITPQPTSQQTRSTRALVDEQYHCGTRTISYYGLAITEACSDKPDFIGGLVSAVGSSGLPPGGFSQWTTSYSCSPPSSVTVSGNWWVDCPGGFSVGNGVTVDFAGGNVVFDGGISMSNGSALSFNDHSTSSVPATCQPPLMSSWSGCTGSSSAAEAYIVLRAGSIASNGGQLTVSHATMVEDSGILGFTGSSLPPVWTAPTAGPFAGLGLWSEATATYTVNGGAGMVLQGIFFMPGATLKLTGGGSWGQLSAQLITRFLTVSGGGSMDLVPDPNESISVAPVDGQLIR